jgi:hypothetical protein
MGVLSASQMGVLRGARSKGARRRFAASKRATPLIHPGFTSVAGRRATDASRRAGRLRIFALILLWLCLGLAAACSRTAEPPPSPLEAQSTQDEQAAEGIAAYQAGEFASALEILLPLAEEGHSESQATVAAMYEQGKGVERSWGHAFEWYRRAAEQDHAAAQYALATFYAYGYGVAQDYAQAALWAERARENGYGASLGPAEDESSESTGRGGPLPQGAR